jgi:hypothetical protein
VEVVVDFQALLYIVAEEFMIIMNNTELSENDVTVLKWLCLRIRTVENVLVNQKNSYKDIALPREDINRSYLNLEKLGYINLIGNLVINKQKIKDYC